MAQSVPERWLTPHRNGGSAASEYPDKVAAAVREAKAKAEELKNSTYVLGKAPDHLSNAQEVKLEMIQANDKVLYRAYLLKESLRLLLKMNDVDEAEKELKHWLWWASHSRIPEFKELYKKIKRHKEHILNTIRLGMSNARIEATNNKIKLIIITVPLPNRKPTAAKAA